MEYFLMDQDARTLAGAGVDYRDAGFLGSEPFVTWFDFDEETKLPDFLQGEQGGRAIFCISDEMKEILDNYGCLKETVPVFLTDTQYRAQKVYWKIEAEEADCLEQDWFADKQHMIFESEPPKGRYLFQARNIKKKYLIVSLELAENLLRRHMYGIQFYPVRRRSGDGTL